APTAAAATIFLVSVGGLGGAAGAAFGALASAFAMPVVLPPPSRLASALPSATAETAKIRTAVVEMRIFLSQGSSESCRCHWQYASWRASRQLIGKRAEPAVNDLLRRAHDHALIAPAPVHDFQDGVEI